MEWINLQLQKLRQRMQTKQKQQAQQQNKQNAPTTTGNKPASKKAPAAANGNMEKAKAQANTANIKPLEKGKGSEPLKNAKHINTSATAETKSYKPKNVPTNSRGRSKGKGMSL